MTGKPLYVRDVDRMRGQLNISAIDRVRFIVEARSQEVVELDAVPDSGKLSIQMECIACEELLEWEDVRGWWVCPICQQETTADEVMDLFKACYEAFGAVLGVTGEGENKRESTDDPVGKGEGPAHPRGGNPQGDGADEGEGVTRWVRRLKVRFLNP